jgi:hypothetical protein
MTHDDGEDTLAARERQGLCDLLDQLYPDTATLCDGWTTPESGSTSVLREARSVVLV